MPYEVIRLSHVRKDADHFCVLRDVHLSLFAGECHGVLIRNDMARETLVDILLGLQTPDRGDVFFKERKRTLQSSILSRSLGIYSIRSQSQLISDMSTAENLFITNDAYYQGGFQNHTLMNTMARELFEEAGLGGLNPQMPAYTLSPAQAHIVELLKVLSLSPCVLILDNIFHHYTQREFSVLSTLLSRRMPDCAVLFLSNQHNPLFRAAQRITVFRKSSTAITLEQRSSLPRSTLLAHQSAHGTHQEVSVPVRKDASKHAILSAEDIFLAKPHAQFSFQLHEQEILCLLDEEGYHHQHAALLFSAESEGRGYLRLANKPLRYASIREAMQDGLHLIDAPGKPKLLHNLSLSENITLTMHSPIYNHMGFSNDRLKSFVAHETLVMLCAEDVWKAYADEKYLPPVSRSDEFVILLARCLCHQPTFLFLVNPHLYFDDLSVHRLSSLLHIVREQTKGIVIFSINREASEMHCDRIHRIS